MHKNIIGTGIIALVVGFGAGYMVHTSPVPAQNTPDGFAGGSGRMMRGGANGGGFLSGTVAKQDSGSMTINTRDGSSHVVFITPTTTVSKSVNGALTDVATGATVIVSGTTNSDGSVSATLIQLRPATPETPPAK